MLHPTEVHLLTHTWSVLVESIHFCVGTMLHPTTVLLLTHTWSVFVDTSEGYDAFVAPNLFWRLVGRCRHIATCSVTLADGLLQLT